MTVKPLLIMDFDGVWNALNRQEVWIGENKPGELDMIFPDPKNWKLETLPISNETHFTPDEDAVVKFDGKKVYVQWSTELVKEVNALIEEGTVDFLWLTTWKEKTDTILNPMMGLNVSEGAWIKPTRNSGSRFFVTSYDFYQVGKWVALKDFFAGIPESHRPPIVWFEDVATENMVTYQDASNKVVTNDLGVPALVFQTAPDVGISRAEWEYAKSWIKSL